MSRCLTALAMMLVVCGRAAAAQAPVPILEFHVVANPPAGTPNLGLYDAPTTFRGQLAKLALDGYHAVTLDEVYRAWSSDGWLALPPKPIVLTFDDGYPQDVTVVRPLLEARRWPAVLNLQIGNLTPARVRLLITARWEIDAHTFTHPDLTHVRSSQLAHEVDGSRKWIQGALGQAADFFCYPYGRYDNAVVSEVRRSGYVGAETENLGDASPQNGMFTLDRIEVTRTDGVDGLMAKLG